MSPRQVGCQAMVLMKIVTRVREHELRADCLLERLEDLLDGGAVIRQESVPEGVHLDGSRSGGREERVGARARLLRTRLIGGEDNPGHVQLRKPAGERQDGSATADLDVVGMATDDEQRPKRLMRHGPAIERTSRDDRPVGARQHAVVARLNLPRRLP